MPKNAVSATEFGCFASNTLLPYYPAKRRFLDKQSPVEFNGNAIVLLLQRPNAVAIDRVLTSMSTIPVCNGYAKHLQERAETVPQLFLWRDPLQKW